MKPVLSKRALEQLLDGHHQDFINVMVGEVIVHRVHRPVATRFSGVWKRDLSNPGCAIVRLTFPRDPPAASSAGKDEEKTGNANVAAVPPRLSHREKNRLALKFVVQWMEKGGADPPQGDNAVTYPKTRPGLESLLSLAERLEVRELADRVKVDLRRVPVPPRKVCQKCPRLEHPGVPCQACYVCKEVGHFKDQCPVRKQRRLEYLEREEKKRLWKEECARRDRVREELRRAQEERDLQRGIRTGLVGVGADGQTKWRWEKGV